MIQITPETNLATVNELKTAHMLEGVSLKYHHLEDCLRDCFPSMTAEDPILMMHAELMDTYRAAGEMALVNAHAKRVMVRFREYADKYCKTE
uniref:Uncharacterized protein n=1 Tax=Serratia phage Kevin TaxID=3161161 RepID=A0AAU8L0K0_9CAUD